MTVGQEFFVNTTTAFANHTSPDISHLKDGNFIVTWGSPTGEISGQRWDADGNKIGVEFVINTTTTYTQSSPSVEAFSDGGFLVAWVSPHKEENKNALNHDVMAQRFNADGTPNGSEFQVNTEVQYDQTSPSVAVLKDDKFVITWDSLNQDSNKQGVYGQQYNADGSVDGAEFLVNTETFNSQQHSDIVALEDGGYWVVWDSRSQEPNDLNAIEGFGIYAQKYNEDGSKNGAEFQVNTHEVQDQANSNVIQLKNGNIVITWESFDQDETDASGYQGIYSQLFKPNGDRIGQESLVNTYTKDGQRLPYVAALEDGGYIVTWNSNAQEDGDSLGFAGVYGQKFKADGSADGAEFHINEITKNSQGDQAIATLGDGKFVVVWTSSDNSNVAQNGINGIKAKIFGESTSGGGGSTTTTTEGTTGNDVIEETLGGFSIAGDAGHDKISVLSGVNDIDGGDDNDFIIGGYEADTLEGGAGDDVIRGDASELMGGSDIIEGGAGNDLLMGGNGADLFKFSTNDGDDVIGHFKIANVNFDASTGYSATADGADFQSGIDHIELSGFTSVDASNVMDSISDVAGSAVFSAEGTEITFHDILEAQLSADDFLFV